jgi:hypothetical protein
MRYWDERFPNDILDLISQGIFPASGHSGIGLGFGKMGAQGAQ